MSGLVLDVAELLSGVSDDWLNVLDNDELTEVLPLLGNPSDLAPTPDKIFEFARLTELDSVKVVILGQDPYPKAGDAHGLAFSCLSGVPGSLGNIYKCLFHHKLIDQIPSSGDLTYWASQGVLLLNTSLTTKVGASNAHKDHWKKYTDIVIRKLVQYSASKNRHLIFMLWGNNAIDKKRVINDELKQSDITDEMESLFHILEYAHPSPIQTKAPFVKCNHFMVANDILKELGYKPIDWNQDTYENTIAKKFFMHERKALVFTDGSAYPNVACKESRAGYAAIFALGVFKDTLLYGNIENTIHYATNQRAEGIAILRALEFLENKDSWDECHIITDSEFWIKMIEMYMPGWARAGTNFDEKKNSDITKKLWSLYTSLTNKGKSITLKHMRSHQSFRDLPKESYEYFCGDQNEYVDKTANYARANLAPGTHMVDTVEYE